MPSTAELLKEYPTSADTEDLLARFPAPWEKNPKRITPTVKPTRAQAESLYAKYGDSGMEVTGGKVKPKVKIPLIGAGAGKPTTVALAPNPDYVPQADWL
jgi:hypothetical protein